MTSLRDLPHTVYIVHHPVLGALITRLRTAKEGLEFAQVLAAISTFLMYETLKDLATDPLSVDTGLGMAVGSQLVERGVALVPIVRAGEGLLPGFREMLPSARVWHLGLSRDETTLTPSIHRNNLPRELSDEIHTIIVLDVMLATGGSAELACGLVHTLAQTNPGVEIIFVGVIAAPEGIERLNTAFPEMSIVLAQVDSHLNEKGYIVPGLGDAGDKLFPI